MSLNNGTLLNAVLRTKLLNPLDTEGGGGPLDPSWYVFVIFSYLLHFCRQWHVCKLRILGDLSTHLFCLVFRLPTSEKMPFGTIGPPLSSITVRDSKNLFFKNS